MRNGEIRVITAGIENKRRKIFYLIPLFLVAVIVGFFLDFTTYESLSRGTSADIRLAIAHLPRKLNRIKNWKVNDEPEFLKNLSEQTIDYDGKEVMNQRKLAKLLGLWKEPTLLNLNNFTWLRNNETICQVNSTSIKVMPILIHTARSHFEERLIIRQSWGSDHFYKNWTIRLVFLLGEADRGLNPQINQKEFERQEAQLDQEQNNYGDLVTASFIDSYKNLTYKHLMGYKWILNFCRNAEFVLKVDDDMFVDVLRFIDWRTTELEILQSENKSDQLTDLYCHTFGGAKPIREKGSKWYSPENQWVDDYYPDYCSGWAYGITVHLIELIYSVSNRIKFFWIDDVFVTGALLEVVKKVYYYEPEIRHMWGKVTMDIKGYRQFCKTGDISSKRQFEAVAVVDRGITFERDMMCLWNKTLYDAAHEREHP